MLLGSSSPIMKPAGTPTRASSATSAYTRPTRGSWRSANSSGPYLERPAGSWLSGLEYERTEGRRYRRYLGLVPLADNAGPYQCSRGGACTRARSRCIGPAGWGGERRRGEAGREGEVEGEDEEGADGSVFFAAKWQRARANRVGTSAATSQEYTREPPTRRQQAIS